MKNKISKNELQNVINKARLLGCLTEIPTACGHVCYLISQSDTQHLMIIPDDVRELNNYSNYIFTTSIHDLEGALKVIGGSNLVDARVMFSNCDIQSINLSDFDTSNIENMYSMFYNCRVQSLDLSSFNTSKVTDMSEMFNGCDAKFLNISSFNTSNVTDMSWMFSQCQLETLDLSHFDTHNVTDMSYMFTNSRLKSINLSSFDTSNVTDMKMMFNHCDIECIDIRNFDTSKVEDMRSMFEGCILKELDISSFDTSNVKDMSSMFKKCKIDSIDLKSLNTEKAEILTEILSSFTGKDISITLNALNCYDAFALFKDSTFESLNVIFNGPSKVIENRLVEVDGMFDGCKVKNNLTISFCANTDNISARCMFRNCEAGNIKIKEESYDDNYKPISKEWKDELKRRNESKS